MKKARVSVIIPVKNEEKKIRKCIEGILRQSHPAHEIIVIDSGSTDKTLQILGEYPEVRVITIEPSDFNHGLTRNLGVQEASGDFCLLTVGDAYAVDDNLITALLHPFKDKNVSAVCGQQAVEPLPENNPLQWFAPTGKPNVKSFQFSHHQWKDMPPEKKKKIIRWDDVNAMYLRSALLEHPFTATSYSEDAIWANEAIACGKKIAYTSHGRVFHYHHENHRFTFKRTLTTLYFRYRLFKYVPNTGNFFLDNLKIFYRLFLKYDGTLIEKLKWLRYNIIRNHAQYLAQIKFRQYLKKGDEALDKYHTSMCGKPPIPVK